MGGDARSRGRLGHPAAADIAPGAARAVGWLYNGDGSLSFAFAAPGDTNLDWQVDVLDAADFITTGLSNQGPYSPPAGVVGQVSAVPEPSAVSLAAIFGGWLVVRRWRRWRSLGHVEFL